MAGSTSIMDFNHIKVSSRVNFTTEKPDWKYNPESPFRGRDPDIDRVLAIEASGDGPVLEVHHSGQPRMPENQRSP